MARATQGLQIALIISVMLNVVLGVTTYLYNKQAFEKTNLAAQARSDVTKEQQNTKAVEEKFKTLASYVGHQDWGPEQIDQFKSKWEEDQQTAGEVRKQGAEGEQKSYIEMIARLAKTVDDRNAQLENMKRDLANLDTSYRNLQAARDNAVKDFEVGVAKQTELANKNNAENQKQLRDLIAAQDDSIKSAQLAGQQLNTKVAHVNDELVRAEKLVKKKDDEINRLIPRLRDADTKLPDPPSGEIKWVSLSTRTVWIDRGRADNLPTRIRLTVYGAESNTAAKAVEKGIIEVTRVVGDHQAECRIVDDKFADPMTTGDKVFTAFWTPGQQYHFAFCGLINLDGDGRNQVKTAIGLVKNYGGVVDCWLDEQGQRQGSITTATQYLVRGDLPDKSSAATVKNNSDIERDASQYKLHDWTLSEFKQRLNYQKSSSVEHFGAGASSGDTGPAPAAAKTPAAPKAPAASSDDDFGK
jgi:uncharacterized coiled-coil protein SlyX